MKKRILFIFAIFLFVAMIWGTEEISGLKVIENVYNRPTPKEQSGYLTMTLINKRGAKRIRKIRQFLKDFGTVEKKIMFFIEPADVKNTSFMNWSYNKEGKDDDQWIYLPALKKIKRISSDNKNDYFMGSDFTYDDLGDRKPNEDTHKILREEKYQNEDCYVIESIPKDKNYMYSKTISRVVKDKWLILKKEFYDEEGELLKILTVEKYNKIKDYQIILKSKMYNVQKEHTTLMELEDIKVDAGISNGRFTERMMRRGL